MKLVGAILTAAVLAGLGVYLILDRHHTDNTAEAAAGSVEYPMRPAFALPDVDGKTHTISEWDGKVILVNFWATWCPPCQREIPDFIEVKDAYGSQGFEIIGVAIDNPVDVHAFSKKLGINYPVLHGQADANQVAVDYGDTMGALPYSVLLDRSGRIRYSGAGGLTKKVLEDAVKSLI